MKNTNKTNEQLLVPVNNLNKNMAEMEKFKTEHKQVEEKIHQHHEELQIILDSIPALVFYKDKEDRFIRVNKALSDAFNMSNEEIIGQTAAELSPGKDYWEDDKRVMKTGNSLRNIIEPMETPEGTVWLRTDKIPYKDSDGNIIGIIGFSIDITKLKQAEKKLISKNKELQTFNDIVVGRELKMLELKKEVNELLEKSGKKPKYKIPT